MGFEEGGNTNEGNMPFLRRERDEMRARLGRESFDLVIIGGGINGVSIARDAALRGYSVALLEQNDFAFGTSSRSSRLIHGGLRYLEQARVRLVFESVSERSRLSNTARHIVRPLPFIFPVYKGDRSVLTMDIGLWIYDALALFRNYRDHESLTPLGISKRLPGVRLEGLRGGVLYYDYATDDARLVLENALAALAANVALLSYCRVEGIERRDGRVEAAVARDLLTGETITVRGRTMICAAGPWTDRVLQLADNTERYLLPTKGVHIVVPSHKLQLGAALVMRHPTDSRVLFALPYHEHSVLGTTDTNFDDDPGAVYATAEDVRYLLDASAHYFPEAKLTTQDVISSWAGVRPLLHPGEVTDPSRVSREHRIEARSDGIVVIAGGKLTTYRRMAEECVDVAARAVAEAGGTARLRHPATHKLQLPGADGLSTDAELSGLASKLSEKLPHAGQHLAYTYGTRAPQLLQIVDADAGAGQPIVAELPFIWAEVTFAAREELALTVTDVLCRRTQVFYRAADQGLSVAEHTAELMGRELGWDAGEQSRQVRDYNEEVARNRSWRS
jgi:glycerol-3-phosphate dehydrogenase